MSITKKQKQFYDFICEYIQQNAHSPTQKEIKDHFGFKSLGSVQDYIKYLTNAGYLKHDPNAVRGLEPAFPHGNQSLPHIPMLGVIAAGKPIEAIEDQQYLELPYAQEDVTKLFALIVRGDSMIDAGIHHGDTVIIESRSHANNGSIVVADVEGEVTLKKLQVTPKSKKLMPANPHYSPIDVTKKNWCIKGVLKSLIRNY